jgi:hypothetical protein
MNHAANDHNVCGCMIRPAVLAVLAVTVSRNCSNAASPETHLIRGQDLTVGLLHSPQLPEEVPDERNAHFASYNAETQLQLDDPGDIFACGSEPEQIYSCPSYGDNAEMWPYQNLLLALTASSAQTFILNTVGLGSESVGKWRPTTWYWWNLNKPCVIAGDTPSASVSSGRRQSRSVCC